MSDFDAGVLLGILIEEGHFGGDRLRPQVTVKTHTRHEPLFQWLLSVFSDLRLYGPYQDGKRRFYQWMVRGKGLRERLIPLLDGLPLQDIDPHAFSRYQEMKGRYGL
jgi:hypothetical protein